MNSKNWRTPASHYDDEDDDDIVSFRTNVTAKHVEKVLKPIVERKVEFRIIKR